MRVAEAERAFQEEDEDRTQREEIINNVNQVKTKKGTKKDDRLWQHDETIRLIDLVSGEECLCNVRRQYYFDKSRWQNTTTRIQNPLSSEGINETKKEILNKLYSLRVYY